MGIAIRTLCAIALTAMSTGGTLAQSNSDWPAIGNDPGGSQFSPLSQINTQNVSQLTLAWTHRSGDVAERGEPLGPTSLEAVPIHVNSTLYYCTAFNRVFALDPVNGSQKWAFDPHQPAPGGKPLLNQPRKTGICRSVAYWQATEPRAGASCEKRIFKADIHGNVFALDADNGTPCPDFGAAQGHPGYVTHFDYEGRGTDDPNRGSTSGPLVIGDVLVTTTNVRDSAVDANNGFVRGFDVRTGELKWEFDPIPPAYANQTGAANVWSTMSADPERGLVFLPTTSPSSDFYGATRTFDIPYADATIALDAETGVPVWHYQAVHHDLFDFDLPGHALLVDITKDGQKMPVAIQPTKLGRVLVFDRATGQPVFPIEERPVPQSDIPGEKSSPTQPFPVLPEPFSRQTLTEDDIWGLTPIDRAWCKARFRELRYEGPYTPPSERGSLIFPFGGANWGGTAFDKANNQLIVKGQNMALRVKLIKKADAARGPNEPPAGSDMPGTPYRVELGLFLSPIGTPCTPPPFGTVSAIDMDTGKLKWQVPLGQSKYMGITAPAFFNWGSPNIGGPIVTAGGLVFIAASIDGKLRALDAATGHELWQHRLAAPGNTIPMTYMANGKQYVVISAGGNARITNELSDAVMAFTLPDQK
jgi:quinoprotein glucose dehydrogenase